MGICHKPSLRTSLKLNLFSSIVVNGGRSSMHIKMQSDFSQRICKFNMFIRGPVLAWISRGLHENSYTKFHLAKQEWSSKFNPQSY